MINKKPVKSSMYYNGNYIPINKNKVIKLNPEGGLYYRSLLELKVMTYLDINPNIIKWGAEFMEIPYKLTERNEQGMLITSEHRYYPDIYYKQQLDDGTINEVFAEIKPLEQVNKPKLKDNPTRKQIEKFKNDMTIWHTNMSKWKYAINWCSKKGIEFVIMTETYINKLINTTSKYR